MCIRRPNVEYMPEQKQIQPPSQSSLFTPYSIFAYTLVILCASAKLKKKTQDNAQRSLLNLDKPKLERGRGRT